MMINAVDTALIQVQAKFRLRGLQNYSNFQYSSNNFIDQSDINKNLDHILKHPLQQFLNKGI